MVKMLYKKECEDCTTQAEVEVLDKMLGQLRVALKCPDRHDILIWANKVGKAQTKHIKEG